MMYTVNRGHWNSFSRIPRNVERKRTICHHASQHLFSKNLAQHLGRAQILLGLYLIGPVCKFLDPASVLKYKEPAWSLVNSSLGLWIVDSGLRSIPHFFEPYI